MCRYVKYTNTTSQLMYVAEEHSIYGSSRVGVDNRKDTLYKAGSYSPSWGGVGTSRRDLGSKSFELSNHLGNVLVTVSDKPVYKVSSGTIYFQSEITSSSDYYPFGATINGRSATFGNENRFGFQSQERDDEISGSGNLYTAEYWEYDSRLGRRWNTDPLAEKPDNIGWSPYAFCWNNPINVVDPDGRSGEPVINKKDGTITVTQHLVFFGGKATSELSGKMATGIASQWNGAHGKVTVDGKSYKVNFKVTYETLSEADATKMASGNTDIKNNFIRVEDGNKSSRMQLGGNAAWLNTDDDLGGSTTPAHEIGHGLGLNHSSTGGQTKTDVPDIMEARHTQVHPRWSKVGASNEIDPNFRRVSKDEVKAIFKGVTFDENGVGKIGRTTNKIFTKDGN